MTKLEIAKAIKNNNYDCCGNYSFYCSECPLHKVNCGTPESTNPNHFIRIKLIDEYIAKHEKENTMTELQKLEKAIEENRKAGEELQRRFEEYKNREAIVFDDNANWGLITKYGRYVLSVNGVKGYSAEWKSFSSCGGAANGCFSSGQEAINEAIDIGWQVVKLSRGPEAVAKFLLGED